MRHPIRQFFILRPYSDQWQKQVYNNSRLTTEDSKGHSQDKGCFVSSFKNSFYIIFSSVFIPMGPPNAPALTTALEISTVSCQAML